MQFKFGHELAPSVQKTILAAYPHRFTGDHKPSWAAKPRPNGEAYKVQFADDADWLRHTEFPIKADGTLDERATHCISHPTWPNGQ